VTGSASGYFGMQTQASHQHVTHRPAVLGASLLRLSVAQRLAIAAALAAILWAAVAWAILGAAS
jgi:hypothetical protein